ncbi:MAG: Bax inhibitor-1 family protein [Myxococcota bacterium]
MSNFQRYQPQYREPVAVGRSRIAASGREKFIVRTYNHLFVAILAFAAIEAVIFMTGLNIPITNLFAGNWMLVLGAFVIAGMVASGAAHRAESLTSQYLALAGYVVVEALIFVPILTIASLTAPAAIPSAGMVTVLGFAGLTAIVFYTRKDFSWLRGVVMFGGVMAIIAIVAAMIFNFALGVWFSVAMVGLAGASILYNTSNIVREYPEDRYVGAALSLFASVAMLFFYVLRLFMSRD